MRTLLGRKSTNQIASYVRDIVEPLWLSLQLQPQQAGTEPPNLQQLLERTCKRLEKAADKLEKAAR